jgi:hypothetical protein
MTPLSLDNDLAGNGVSLIMSQSADATARWRFKILGQSSDGTIFTVGYVYSSPPNATEEPGVPTRLLAIAYVPGVVRWTVEVDVVLVEGVEPEAACQVWLESNKYNGGILGLRRVGERYHPFSGVDGAVVLKYGQYPTSWAAVCGAAPGTLAIQRGAELIVQIEIPANTAASGEIPPGSMFGGVSFNFTDTESYILETLESA